MANDLNKNVTINVIANFLSQGIGFLMSPIYARLLTTADYGISAIYISWVAIVSIFVCLQIYGSINNAYNDYGEEGLARFISSIWWVASGCFVILIALFLVFGGIFSELLGLRKDLIPILIAHAFAGSCINIMIYYLRVIKKVKQSSAISLLLTALSAAASLLLIYFMKESEELYMGRIWGVALPNVAIGIAASAYILKTGGGAFDKGKAKYALKLSLPLVVHGLSGYLLAQSDRQMLFRMVNEAEAGIYGYSYTLSSVSNMIWAAINAVWAVYFYEHIRNGTNEELMAHSRKYLHLFSAITVACLLVTQDVIRFTAPEEYWPGAAVAPYIILSNYLIFLYSFPVNFEFFHKRTARISIGTIIAAIINIALNFLLIPAYKSVGAAVATAVSYLLLFIFHDLSARKIAQSGLTFCYTWKFYLTGLLPVIAAAVLAELLVGIVLLRWGIVLLVVIAQAIRIIRQKGLF